MELLLCSIFTVYFKGVDLKIWSILSAKSFDLDIVPYLLELKKVIIIYHTKYVPARMGYGNLHPCNGELLADVRTNWITHPSII